ncbi:MAG: hypothetical protein AVDCRST_MAG53-545 [uncultured Solirubrobacteraceae bacterium]|uniref:Uncharacterized protein n=1 Tax=uncultured Solirubrobacteraceae bacterium TaxID=1162706 RepID=A0A6J4S0F8_9ACTN|nr:MAG: hypothetical protein AVDCRST_MAG53-545 [uncultured Solirubrobacteraceae bacterium]
MEVLLRKSGPLTSSVSEAFAFVRSRQETSSGGASRPACRA